MTGAHRDVRLDALTAWLNSVLPAPMASIAPASSDASFRRYFRVKLSEPSAVADRAEPASSLIAMDAPPPQENCRPYVAVAQLLASAGVHAPAILAADLERGFLLTTDLGTRMYLDALDDESAPKLYRDASAALVRWQRASREDALPPYDKVLLRRELDLFPDWYVARHLGVALSERQRMTLETAFELILANNLAQPRVFVHRDYHSRNLMVAEPNPGVLDFQDAVFGPITYDLVSLLRDAYIEWDEARQLDWAARYWAQARATGLPVASDFAEFWRDVEWMGLQRHLKVLGIFARLNYRDGKQGYLEDTPRFVGYVRHAVNRYGELAALGRMLDEVEGKRPEARYTF